MSAALVEQAPAKVNLALEVIRRRPDGYHEISTVLQAVDLRDTLTIEPSDEIRLTCTAAAIAGPENLVLRAARLLRERSGRALGAHLRLTKRIPVAAGLGGGSSDAAAALRGLTRLWGLPYGPTHLEAIAAELGSDVPFFVGATTAWATGRGDRIERLPSPSLWIVLIPSERTIDAKTPRLYAALEPTDLRDGKATRQLVARLRSGEGIDEDLLVNSFTEPAMRLFDGLRERRDRIARILGRRVHLAGSGPTLFVVCESASEVDWVAASLQSAGLPAIVTRALDEVERA